MTDPRAPVVALVPVRELGTGKSRLAGHLDPDERAALTAAMLADVTMALRHAPVDRIVVVAAGGLAAAAARALRLDVVLDPPHVTSLNASLRTVTSRLGAVATLVVVMADLPRLSPSDVTDLVTTDAQVVVAATDDGGTGALLRRPPAIIPTAYGPESAARHLRMGHAAGAQTVSVDLPGFRHDVDTAEDLQALRDGPLGPMTSAFLEKLGSGLDPG